MFFGQLKNRMSDQSVAIDGGRISQEKETVRTNRQIVG
jgi:hypothetical protein